MKTAEINSLTVCKDNYKSEKDWKDAISTIITFLLNEDYIMTVRYDEKAFGIVIIEYQYNKSYGCAYPYWLLPEEFERGKEMVDEE